MNRRLFVRSALLAGSFGAAASPVPVAAKSSVQDDPICNVKDFGAKGDGNADDTAAIQKAVDSGGGTVYFPKGSYRITGTVSVDLERHGNTSIVGHGTARVLVACAGPAFHLKGTHEGSADPEQFKEGVWDRERLPLITGIEIRGQHPESVGVRLQKTVQATLTNLLIRRCRVGVHFVERNRNPIVSHCHVYHNLEVGVFFDAVNLHQAIIADNHISYNPIAGILIRGGNMRNFQIVGNDIEYNYDKNREGSADVLVDMRSEGSSFREGTIVGNTIQARVSPGGANVRIYGGGAHLTGGMMAICGNLIGNQTDNVHLVDCRNVSLSGNALYSANGLTFVLERCANITLGNNTIDWNPSPKVKGFNDGIAIRDSDGVVFSNTILENTYAGSAEEGGSLRVDNSRDVTIADCQVLDPRHRGIVLNDAVRCRVTGCTIIDRGQKKPMRAAVQVRGKSRDNFIGLNTVPKGGLDIAEGTALLKDNMEI